MFKRQKRRSGTESVEVAITLPLLLLVMVATLNITHRWHVEKMLKVASFEAIKAGSTREGTSADAIRVFNEHATALGLTDARLDVDASIFDNAEVGDLLMMQGTAPVAGNQFLTPINLVFSDQISGGWIFYRKEGL